MKFVLYGTNFHFNPFFEQQFCIQQFTSKLINLQTMCWNMCERHLSAHRSTWNLNVH